MNEPVENGVGEGPFADVVMPDVDRELTGNEVGLAAMSVVEDLEQIASGVVVEGASPKSSIRTRSALAKPRRSSRYRPSALAMVRSSRSLGILK